MLTITVITIRTIMIVLKPMAIVIHKPIKEIVIVIQKYKKRIFKQKKKKEEQE